MNSFRVNSASPAYWVINARSGARGKAKELAQVLKRLDTVSNVAEVMEQLELPEAHIGQV